MKAETLQSSASGRLFNHFQAETRSVGQPLINQALTHHVSTRVVSERPAQTSSLRAAARASFHFHLFPPPGSPTTPRPLALSHDRHTSKKYCDPSGLELSDAHLGSPLELRKCGKPVLSLHTPGRAAGVGRQARARLRGALEERTSKRPQSAPPRAGPDTLFLLGRETAAPPAAALGFSS